jgi:hypothetical protein
LFDNPSIAQQVSDTVRRIVGDTERIRENAGRISRASVIMERNFAKMVNSSSRVAANLNAIITQLQNATSNASALNNNMANAAQNANNTANNAGRANRNLTNNNNSAKQLKINFMTIAKIIGGGMVAGLGAVISVMSQLQKQGLTLQQNFDTVVQSIKNLDQVFRTGVVAGFGDLARAQVGLGRNLGNIKNVSNLLIESTVELSNAYGVSEKTAAKINAQLFRWNGRNAELVRYSQRYAVALANVNGQLPADIIEEMAQNTDELARFANKGADGFARQVAALNKMGVSMKSIAGLADSLVMDFEGSLESAAKLQTFLPGFNISGLQFAAQFGTNEQVATELQTLLQRTGVGSLDRLPRSLQNAVSGSLRMPLTEIQNLLTNTEADTKVRQPTVEDLENNFKRAGNSLLKTGSDIVGAITDGVNKILLYLGARDAVGLARGKLLKNLNRTGTLLRSRGTLSTVGKAARIGARVGGAAPLIGAVASLATGGGIGGAVGTAAGGTLGAILGSILLPGIGTAVGGFIGSYFGEKLGRGISKLAKSSNDLAETNAEAKKVQEEQTAAMKDSKKAAEEAALKQAAAAAGVKDFNFAMRELQRQRSGSALGASPTMTGSAESPGFFSFMKSAFLGLKYSGVFHEGGVVGEDMLGRGNSLSDLKNLKPQETIAILERGEVVLTPTQMTAMGRAVGGGLRGNINNIINGFMNSFNMGSNRIVQNIRAALSDKGGFLGKIGSFFEGSNIGQTISSKLSGLTDKIGPIGQTVQNLVGGLESKVQGLTGGLVNKGKNMISGWLGGNKSSGGMLGGIKSFAGGSDGNGILGSITKSLSGGNILGSITNRLGGSMGIAGKVSGLLSGGLKDKAAGLVSKIPGVGGIAGSLLKGGGIKGIGSNLLKAGAGKAIGGMVGSLIPIPGVGTLLGSTLGGLASKGISKLANSKVGKAIGGVGKKLGGLFRRKKKKETTPSSAPLDLGNIGGMVGSPGGGTLLGGLASKGISKLANSRVGKAVTGFLGKSPVAQVGKKVLGGIGKKLGGLFGRGKKKEAAPSAAPLDLGNMGSMTAGMLGTVQGMPNILSMFSGAGDSGLQGAVAGLPSINISGGSSTQVKVDTANLEGKIDQLINLMRSGGIAVNLDGRKVSSGLMEANRYG